MQELYRRRHAGSEHVVRANDVFFALHAALLTAVILFQIAIYDRGQQRISPLCKLLTIGIWTGTLIYAIVCFSTNIDAHLLGFLYYLASVKMGISFIKYCPQVWMNYTRKSTLGWSIGNVFLDFAGGALSVLQLVMDCWLANDWTGMRLSLFDPPLTDGDDRHCW